MIGQSIRVSVVTINIANQKYFMEYIQDSRISVNLGTPYSDNMVRLSKKKIKLGRVASKATLPHYPPVLNLPSQAYLFPLQDKDCDPVSSLN